MRKLKIIIAGGRDFDDYDRLKNSVAEIIHKKYPSRDIIAMISGGAKGADKLGERFAEEFDLHISKFPANWSKHGKKAGFIRNIEMAKFAVEDTDLGILIAFWDGKSKGTKHMIDTAQKYGLEVHIVCY